MISAAPYTIHHSPQGMPPRAFLVPSEQYRPSTAPQTHAAQPLASWAMPEGYF